MLSWTGLFAKLFNPHPQFWFELNQSLLSSGYPASLSSSFGRVTILTVYLQWCRSNWISSACIFSFMLTLVHTISCCKWNTWLLQQHYTIRSLSVMAECSCNGHQTDCRLSNDTGTYDCVCGGNTAGKYCEKCQPGFNQKPFRYGIPCQGE